MKRSIEFIGLPGAGKTTIENLIRKELLRNGYLVFSARNLLVNKAVQRRLMGFMGHIWYRLERASNNRFTAISKGLEEELFRRFRQEFPEYVDYCYQLIRNSKATIGRQEVMEKWLKKEGGAWIAFEECKDLNWVYLNDEGFLHRALGYFSEVEISPEAINEYCRLCPQHEWVILVSTSPDTALTRLKLRNDHVLRNIDEISNRAPFEKMRKYCEILDSIFGALPIGTVGRLVNEECEAHSTSEAVLTLLSKIGLDSFRRVEHEQQKGTDLFSSGK